MSNVQQDPDVAGPGGRVWRVTGASSCFGRELAEAALAAGDTAVARHGRIDVLVNGAALQQSATQLDACAESVGAFRTALPDTDGKQPGDPARAAAAILRALDAEQTPLRLALGTDAVEAIGDYLETARTGLSRQEAVSRGADFEA